MKRWIVAALLLLLVGAGAVFWTKREHTPEAKALNVLLIPADGGTESGTLADYQPIFNAVSRSTGLTFNLKVAQSYGAVVEGMCNGAADIAFVGPVPICKPRIAVVQSCSPSRSNPARPSIMPGCLPARMHPSPQSRTCAASALPLVM